MRTFQVSLLVLLALFSFSSFSLDTVPLKKNQKLNIVIHVTESHGGHYRAALNYAHIIRDTYGKDNVNIEVVANGPGIGLVNSNNRYTANIKKLMHDGVRFSACNTTAKFMRENQELPIIENVQFVPYGVVHVLELQRKGYLYLRP